MARINLSVWVVCVCLVTSFGGPVWAQQPRAGQGSAKSKRSAWLHEVYLRDASAYKFFLDDQKRQELKLRREPVMRWTSDGDYNGEVYVWTHQGAAAIVGCIFSGPRGKDARSIMHEFHSLAPNRLYAGERGGIRLASSGTRHQARAGPRRTGTGQDPSTSAHANARPGATLHLAGAEGELEVGNAAAAPADLPLRDIGREFAGRRWGRCSPSCGRPEPTQSCSSPSKPVARTRASSGITPRRGSPTAKRGSSTRAKRSGKPIPPTVGIFDGVTTTPYGAFQVKTIPNKGEE